MTLRAFRLSVLMAASAFVVFNDVREARAATPPSFEPEQLVRFTGKGFSCESREAFVEAITHSVNREKTLFARMFDEGKCGQLPTTLTMKVLRVERTMLELEAADSSGQSVWTAPEFVVPSPSGTSTSKRLTDPIEMSKP